MTLFKSFRLALPIAALLATTAISFAPTSAKAWEQGWTNGTATLWYETGSDGQTKFAVTIEKDGKYEVYFEKGVIDAVFEKMGSSNPNPEDASSKGTEKPDFEELVKSLKGANFEAKVNPEDTPLGGVINGGGGGKVPHWNPGPDDNGSGPSSPPDRGPKGGLTAEQKAGPQAMLNAAVAAKNAIKGGMYDGSEGGTEGPPVLNKNGGTPHNPNNGQGHGDEDGDGKNDYAPTIGEYDNLGPKPELVNPPLKTGGAGNAKGKNGGSVTVKKHVGSADGSVKGGKSGNADKNGKAERTSSVMSPGLLEGGGGFSSNGPSGAGNVMGGGAMTGGTALRGGR